MECCKLRYFGKGFNFAKFRGNKSSRNVEITMSSTDAVY